MAVEKIIRKIPGEPIPSKTESQGFIDDLGKKSLPELQELLERQNKILDNKIFVSKLPDKGHKIQSFREKILKAIDQKNEIEQAAKILSRLNIVSEGKAAMTEMEWTGKYNENKEGEKIVELDSDDETDPLKILAQPTGSGVHKKKVIHLPPEESLIKKEDLEDIESDTAKNVLDLEHVKYIIEKVENSKVEQKEPFKPHKTTKSNVHDPEKEKLRKKYENSSATPPLIVHGAVKILSMSESLKLEKEKTEQLQEIQINQAAKRLAERIGMFGSGEVPSNLINYREPKDLDSSSESENEENQVYDDEDDDKGGTVTYTVDTVEE